MTGRSTLIPLDDYLSHQLPETFAAVYTSDPNFFERYAFGMLNTDLSSFMMATLAVYPNRGFKEAAIGFVHEGREYMVRASTHLGSDRLNTTVGPIKVEVIEGLRKIRITVDSNPWGLEGDIAFEGRHFPHLETRNFVETGDRVTQNYLRFSQIGRYSGNVHVGDTELELAPSAWLGHRDHSWGIRPSGPPNQNHAWAAQRRAGGFLWTWAPMQFDDYALIWSVTEDGSGRLLRGAGAVLRDHDSPIENVHAVEYSHDLRFNAGTRKVDGGKISMVDENGKQWVASFRPGIRFYMSTVGYGGPWAAGTYMGDDRVDGAVLDLSDPAVVAEVDGLVETACEFRCGDDVGYGAFEALAIPPLPRYGLAAGP